MRSFCYCLPALLLLVYIDLSFGQRKLKATVTIVNGVYCMIFMLDHSCGKRTIGILFSRYGNCFAICIENCKTIFKGQDIFNAKCVIESIKLTCCREILMIFGETLTYTIYWVLLILSTTWVILSTTMVVLWVERPNTLPLQPLLFSGKWANLYSILHVLVLLTRLSALVFWFMDYRFITNSCGKVVCPISL